MGVDMIQEMRSRRAEVLSEIEQIDASRALLQGRLEDIDFAIGVIEREMSGRKVAVPAAASDARAPAKPRATAPAVAIGAMKGLWDEILEKLPEMIVSHPRGVSAKDMAAALCADQMDVRSAMDRLVEEGRAAYAERSGGKRAKLLVLIGHVGPKVDLTPLQEVVLDGLRKLAGPDGIVTTPRGEFSRGLERHQATIDPAIRALDAKGYISIRGQDTKVSGRLCYDITVKDVLKE